MGSRAIASLDAALGVPPGAAATKVDERDRALAVRAGLVRRGVLAATFATGATGLVYEVAWHQYLTILLGNQARATATILAVFLGGLSAGYFLFGRYSARRSGWRLVLACGTIEAAIGIWGLAFPEVFALWAAGGVRGDGGALTLAGDALACVALLGAPAVLMGGTLPLLTQGLARSVADSAPLHARIYAVNTTGAFLGCLMAGFVLLPQLGLPNTTRAAGMLNLAAGAGLVGLATIGARTRAIAVPGRRRRALRGGPDSVSSPGRAAAIAALAGFCALAWQSALVRLVGLSVGSSEYAFSLVVAVFILMLAAGAWSVSRRRDPAPLWANQLAVLIGGVLLYVVVPYWGYAGHVLRTLLTSVPINFYIYHAAIFGALAVCTFLPVGAMGRTMPLLFRAVRADFETLGARAGVLYAANTAGCVLGATVGGYWLLYVLDLDQVVKVCLIATAMTVWLAQPQRPAGTAAVIAALGLFIGVVGLRLPDWDRQALGIGAFRAHQPTAYTYEGPRAFHQDLIGSSRVLLYDDSPNTTVAVVENDLDPFEPFSAGAATSRALYVNGKSDGSTTGEDVLATKLMAHLPALLHTAASRRAAVVGFGTGLTLGALALYDGIETIDCFEISPAVLAAAPLFDGANGGVSSNPKVHFVLGDAYRVLGSSDARYALIVSEPTNPWMTGVEKLYSREFYRAVHGRLDRGGIYVQWVQLYSFSEPTLGLVLRTFAAEFPSVRIFEATGDLLLLGSDLPLDGAALAALEARASTPAVRADLKLLGLDSPEQLFLTERWVAAAMLPGSEYQTLLRPRLAYLAGKDFFLDKDVGVETLLRAERNGAWARRQADGSLLNTWLRQAPDRAAALQVAAARACNVTTPAFFDQWQSAPALCRQALVALAVEGVLDPAQGLSSRDVAILRELAAQSPAPTAATAGHGVRAIRLFAAYDSILLPLSAERLLAAAPCNGAHDPADIECRAELVRALTWTNHGSLAAREFDALAQDAGDVLEPALRDRLRQLVAEALRAQGGPAAPG
jgi:spermidine synthase